MYWYWFYYGKRGEAYANLKQVDLSIKDFEAALKLKKNMPHVQTLLALNYVRKNDISKAIEHLTLSFSSEPNDAWARNLRGKCYLNSGMYTEALNDFSIAVELKPTSVEYEKNKNLAMSAVKAITNKN